MLQQLAVLLITRQIIQNIKESALPYLIEQFRLAKLSFDIFGALSPSVSKEKRQFTDYFKCKDKKKHTESSTIPQAEVESTLFKVRNFVNICNGIFNQSAMRCFFFSMKEHFQNIWKCSSNLDT